MNRGQWIDNKEHVKNLANTKYIDVKSGKADISQDKEVPIEAWQHIMEFLELGQYAPAGKSKSADYYVYFSTGTGEQLEYFMLAFQCKAGSREYTAQDLSKEVLKCFDMELLKSEKCKLKGIILVLVGGFYKIPKEARTPINEHADMIILDQLKPENVVKSHSKCDCTNCTNRQREEMYSDWPHNLQVLHLTVVGKRQLLSPFNITLLK